MSELSLTADASSIARDIRCALITLPPTPWLPDPEGVEVDLLADGVYHANFTVTSEDRRSVARVVRGSQWGMSHSGQLEREYAVLSDLAPAHVAPAPLAMVRSGRFPFMIESLVPGRYVDHHSDLKACAVAIAGAHACAPHNSERLLDPSPPKEFLLDDSAGRLRRCIVTPDNSGSVRLLEKALRHLSGVTLPAFTPTLIHTDLIQKNLLVEDDKCWIVDWEGARLGCRAWDLAYFLSPVTLRWAEPPATLAPHEQENFLTAYGDEIDGPMDSLRDDIDLFMPFVLLRALSWCIDYASRAAHTEVPSTRSRLNLFTSPDFISSTFARAGVPL